MHLFKGRKAGRVDDLAEDSNEQKFGGDVDFESEKPNVVSSLEDTRWAFGTSDIIWHLPVIDIDFPARLEPSSTEGHFHLYLDRSMTAENLFKLLDVMEEVGLVEPGYVAASKQRGYTTARLPWIRKGQPEPEVSPLDVPAMKAALVGHPVQPALDDQGPY